MNLEKVENFSPLLLSSSVSLASSIPLWLLALVFFIILYSPLMTSAPLGVVCPCPSCFSRPSHLHPICSPGLNLHGAAVTVYMVVLIKGSSHCDLCCWITQSPSALPLFCPSSNSLLGFPACHYGKSIWGDTYFCYFSHLPVFQMEFWASSEAANEFPFLPSKIFTDTKFQEPSLSFPFPALNYKSIASLAVFLFVGLSVPLEHPLLCSTLQGLSLSPGALPTHRQSGRACTIAASGASGVGEDLGWELDLLVNLPFAILKHPWLASCRCTSAACSLTYSHPSPTARSLLWPWKYLCVLCCYGPWKSSHLILHPRAVGAFTQIHVTTPHVTLLSWGVGHQTHLVICSQAHCAAFSPMTHVCSPGTAGLVLACKVMQAPATWAEICDKAACLCVSIMGKGGSTVIWDSWFLPLWGTTIVAVAPDASSSAVACSDSYLVSTPGPCLVELLYDLGAD